MRILKLLIIFMTASFLFACGKHYAKGNGDINTETRSVGAFSQIRLEGGNYRLQINNTSQPLQITTDSNIQPLIETKVSKGVLVIRPKSGYNFSPSQPIVIKANTPNISGIQASGQSQITVPAINTKDFNLNLNGDVRVALAGQAGLLNINAAGMSAIDAQKLKTQNTEIKISGAGEAKVFVTDRLVAQIAGTGHVTYFGSPQSIEKNIAGVGEVTDGDAKAETTPKS